MFKVSEKFRLNTGPIMRLVAIDPGTTHSGYIEIIDGQIVEANKAVENDELREDLKLSRIAKITLVIEMIASYGMPVGAEVFETCVWIGRFQEAADNDDTHLIYRRDVKMELCGTMRANDANIRQALIDMHPGTGGGKKPKIGTKKHPGPLYEVKSHAWAALAVAKTFEAKKARGEL